MGSLQATEVLKEILGLGDSLSGRLIMYDALWPRLPRSELQARSRIARPAGWRDAQRAYARLGVAALATADRRRNAGALAGNVYRVCRGLF